MKKDQQLVLILYPQYDDAFICSDQNLVCLAALLTLSVADCCWLAGIKTISWSTFHLPACFLLLWTYKHKLYTLAKTCTKNSFDGLLVNLRYLVFKHIQPYVSCLDSKHVLDSDSGVQCFWRTFQAINW